MATAICRWIRPTWTNGPTGPTPTRAAAPQAGTTSTTTASPTKRTKPSSKPIWEPSASPEGRSITTSTQRTRRNPKLPGWNPALPPGNVEHQLDERPSPIPPNPGRAGARPSQSPQKAKTPAKAGVHLSTTTSTLPGLNRIPPFLDLFQQLLHFFQRPRGVIQRHARQLAGHVVVEAVQVLGNLAAQFLVQRSLQRTNDTDGAAHRRPPAFGVPGLLGVPCQFQTLDGAIEQQLHRPVLGHFLGQVDLLVGINGAFHLLLILANDTGQAVELGSQERAGTAHLRYQRVHGVELGEQAGFELAQTACQRLTLAVHAGQGVLQRLGAILENTAALGVGLGLGLKTGHQPLLTGKEITDLLQIAVQRLVQLGAVHRQFSVTLGGHAQVGKNPDAVATCRRPQLAAYGGHEGSHRSIADQGRCQRLAIVTAYGDHTGQRIDGIHQLVVGIDELVDGGPYTSAILGNADGDGIGVLQRFLRLRLVQREGHAFDGILDGIAGTAQLHPIDCQVSVLRVADYPGRPGIVRGFGGEARLGT